MNTTPSPQRRRRWLPLRLAVVLLCLIGGLALSEFMLAGWHYGRPTTLLRKVHGNGIQRYRSNIHFHRAYQTSFWPIPEETFMDLTMPKPPGTFRIFVFGGSAVMGYPPDSAVGLPRMLEVQLEAAFQGVRFEVHNAAFPGMNSHAIREAAAECAEYEPDLFIVYAGLEEVYGAYGSLMGDDFLFNHPSWVPWDVWLKRRQLTQFIAQFRGADESMVTARPAMESLPEPDASAWDRMLQTFSENLAATAQSAQGAGAGLLLCTAPFAVRDTTEAPPFGQVLTRTNEAVRAFSADHDGARLADLAGLLAAAAGDDFYDGIHPRLNAVHRMTLALVASVGKALGRKPLPDGGLSLEEARNALGVAPPLEQLNLVTMRRATAEWAPWLGMDVQTVAQALDAEIAAMDRDASDTNNESPLRAILDSRPNDYYLTRQLVTTLLAHGEIGEAADLLEGLIRRLPSRAALYGDLATVYRAEGDFESALEALRNGLAADRWNPRIYWLLGITLLDCRPTEALPSFQRALGLLPGGPDILGSADAHRDQLEAGLGKARTAAEEQP